eukprot:205746_1
MKPWVNLWRIPLAMHAMLFGIAYCQRYHVVTDQGGVNWMSANTYCNATYGTQLATIYSAEDAQQILTLKLSSNAPNNTFWVGLQRNVIENSNLWRWVDDVNYACENDTNGCAQAMYWSPGQPDDVSEERCAGTWTILDENGVDGMLNNFVCEWTVHSGPIHFMCDGIGNGGCFNKSTQRSVLSNRLYACPGIIESGGVYGQSAQQLCADDYHVCDSASETSALGLTSTEC